MAEEKAKTLLVVGAGGFIGGFICAEGKRRGYHTYAGVRESTSRRYLGEIVPDHIINFDYDDPDKLQQQLAENAPHSGWDTIIYNLGATKCRNFADFNKINYVYLRNFVDALYSENIEPRRFLFMSSLSALGNADDPAYTPIDSRTIPNPNTRYGLSKIKAETFLQSLPKEFPWIVLRPTGVYGPHEQDYLMMIKTIDSHFDFGVGMRRQMLTFIYVEDLARAIFDALERAPLHRKYIVSEPRAYTQKEFRQIVSKALGRKLVIPVRLPLWALSIACKVSEKWGAAKMKAVTLNSDKYNIMAQRNWSCDVTPAQRDFGFSPRVDLAEGIRLTVQAYRESKD